MGLTIHYSLRSKTTDTDEARRLIEALRQRALDLPFSRVGELVELRGDDCRSENHDDPSRRWLLTQATVPLFEKEAVYDVIPDHLIAFTAMPGDGCEPANFGLCRYSSEVATDSGQRLTGLHAWSWESFCKTQYASNPQCGGIENFVRCHLTVVGLLDHAAKLDILAEVSDESGFYDGRDVAKLPAEVTRWNRGIAAFTGQLKDLLGDEFAAEIKKFPNFERLEAEGRQDQPE